MSMSH